MRSQPQGMEGYELRIKLQRQLDREADVLPSLARSATADRNNQALQLLLAREYRKANQPMQAEPIYHKLLDQSPTPEVYRGLFDLYKDDRERGGERLLRLLDDAIGKAGGDGDKKAVLNEVQREAAQRSAAHARAMLLVLRGDADLVKLVLPAATRRLAAGSDVNFTTSLMLASLAGRTRQYEAAEKLYRHCLAVRRGTGNEAEIYAGLLTVLSLAHKNKAIIELCEKGLQTAQNTNRLLFLRELAVAHMGLDHVRAAAGRHRRSRADGRSRQQVELPARTGATVVAGRTPRAGRRRVPGAVERV